MGRVKIKTVYCTTSEATELVDRVLKGLIHQEEAGADVDWDQDWDEVDDEEDEDDEEE